MYCKLGLCCSEGNTGRIPSAQASLETKEIVDTSSTECNGSRPSFCSIIYLTRKSK